MTKTNAELFAKLLVRVPIILLCTWITYRCALVVLGYTAAGMMWRAWCLACGVLFGVVALRFVVGLFVGGGREPGQN